LFCGYFEKLPLPALRGHPALRSGWILATTLAIAFPFCQRDTQVDDLGMSMAFIPDVFRFYVAVGDTLFVDRSESRGDCHRCFQVLPQISDGSNLSEILAVYILEHNEELRFHA
jgi:hypothetical protein